MFRGSVAFALALLAAAFTFAVDPPAPAHGQPGWSWPDSAQNLEVLPGDTDGRRMRAVMTGFTRALGVRCNHCHVGEEGQPLATFDFASDENPNKDRAREMMRMMGSIGEHLAAVEPSGEARIDISCNTCHRGRPRPLTLAAELGEVYAKDGLPAALASYRELRETFLLAGSYDFREHSLNQFGYEVLQKGDADGAILVFELNVEMFPESGNARDSLGEAYAAAGRTADAVRSYERALALDPKNKNAAEKLKELKP